MGLINVLSTIFLPSFSNLGEVSLKHEWLCKIIAALINFVGDVGLGIILFTVILKLITLPLDIYSRASTKKNSLKMEMMKDDLEKLKKQYKNNERLYQQKMMSLYKKNGYSAFSACLPTLVTLIFFIIVISGFNNYSRFADKEVFNEMGRAYTTTLDTFTLEENGEALIKSVDGDKYLVNFDSVLNKEGYSDYFTLRDGAEKTETSSYALDFDKFTSKDSLLLSKYPNLGDYISDGSLNLNNKELLDQINQYCHTYVITSLGINVEENSDIISVVDAQAGIYYIENMQVLCERFASAFDYIRTVDGVYEIKYGELLNGDLNSLFVAISENYICDKALKLIGNDYLNNTVKIEARKNSAIAYEQNASKSKIFPWVKNLWVVDSPFKTAIPLFDELEKTLGAENVKDLKGEYHAGLSCYEELTFDLKENYQQKGFGKGNGLFILVALSILTMLGSTVIMNKQQKTQMQLSSVDGENSQAASTQKMMTWMMPIMFGIFAFIYSSAFSIYMITSSLLSTGFTLLISLFVERAFKKQVEEIERQKAEKIKYGKRR